MAHVVSSHEVKKPLPPDDALCINTIRVLAADMVQKANSGHPGMPMGMAPLAHVLFRKFMRFNPANPKWPNRDRFVLSNGHGCALQYIMLHLCGYNLTLDDLKKFRQLDSKTPGHPEPVETPGVEVTTGPLGQGIANSVGLAIAAEHLAAEFNKPGFPVFDNNIFVFCGDGCLQEGISQEAASLAGHLGLGRLIVIYDDNQVTIDGETALSFSDDTPKRFEACGWHTQTVTDSHDLEAFAKAVQTAIEVKDKPSIISVKTIIGFGSSKQGTEAVHGQALGAEDIAHIKKLFGFDPAQSFSVPDKVYAEYHSIAGKGAENEKHWDEMMSKYQAQFPKEHAELLRRLSGKLPADWRSVLPSFKPTDKADATRNISGAVLNAIAKIMPELIGGSADLTPSNKTALKGVGDFSAKDRLSRYLRFGVREHGMIAAGNGITAYGGLIPFTATFFNFIEYGFPSVRLAAISQFRQILIMTHDSIGLGEDGPTHQPIEATTLCRATPNVMLLKPADGNEVSGCYIAALENSTGPSVIALSRHNLPHLPNTSAESVLKGAYVIHDADDTKSKPDLILVGTGSETHLCVEAVPKLAPHKVRVVSMPSWELFDAQPAAYRRSVFIPGVPVISVEAASITGWEKYAHASIGMVTFGTSAPPDDVFKKFGFTADKVAERVKIFLDTMRAQAAELGLPVTAGPLGTHYDLPFAVKPLIAGHIHDEHAHHHASPHHQ